MEKQREFLKAIRTVLERRGMVRVVLQDGEHDVRKIKMNPIKGYSVLLPTKYGEEWRTLPHGTVIKTGSDKRLMWSGLVPSIEGVKQRIANENVDEQESNEEGIKL